MKKFISLVVSISLITLTYASVFAEGDAEETLTLEVSSVETEEIFDAEVNNDGYLDDVEFQNEGETESNNIEAVEEHIYELKEASGDTWSQETSLINSKIKFYAMAIGGTPYVIGGYGYSGRNDFIEKYNG